MLFDGGQTVADNFAHLIVRQATDQAGIVNSVAEQLPFVLDARLDNVRKMIGDSGVQRHAAADVELAQRVDYTPDSDPIAVVAQ